MSKRCPDCGHINEDSRIFCSACGEPLTSELRLIQDLEKQTKKPVQQASVSRKADDEDDDYVPQPTKKKSGCYIATAVYGSYDCPQVWTLRRFRDYRLAATLPGRTFIRLYYAISPTLVRWFGHAQWFRRLWKGPLDRLVKTLQNQGVKDTPYQDRNW